MLVGAVEAGDLMFTERMFGVARETSGSNQVAKSKLTVLGTPPASRSEGSDGNERQQHSRVPSCYHLS